jgi:hypothetical protein
MLIFGEINAWAILTTVIAVNIFRLLWYSPVLFGKLWQNGLGVNAAEGKDRPPAGPIIALIASLVEVTVLALIVKSFQPTEIRAVNGLIAGFLAGAGIAAPVLATFFGFEGKKPLLYLIDIGYYLSALTAAGLILGLWS